MKWNSQQEYALKLVNLWLIDWRTKNKKKAKQVFYLAGFAGTGKSTLAKHFAQNLDGDVCYAAFTGKAALVMRKNGCVGARTIHSLIYKTHQDDKTGAIWFELNRQSPVSDSVLVIVDECSMINEELAKDLLSFGKPILVLGDPGQLPPVEGEGWFTSGEPDFMLTEIHRQAKDNPIIFLATKARMGESLDIGSYGESKIVSKISSSDALDASQVLVGRNLTRESLNRRMRKLLDFQGDLPVKNEKLICLKNDKDRGIFNGGIFTVGQVMERQSPNFYFMNLIRDDEDGASVLVKVHKSFFVHDVPKPDWKVLRGTQSFDWAYAVTCHKAQGSQWESGLILDESYCFRDNAKKWTYTAITRFSDKITIVR